MITKEDIDKFLNEDDYYKLLSIEKTATTQEIEKTFRKLSVKWHPDKIKVKDESLRENAISVFKKLSEAKEILSDQNKREIYDRFGKDGLKDRGPDMNPEHEQEMMNEFMKKMFGTQMNRSANVPNIILVEELSLEDLFIGKIYNKQIERYTLCKDCNGYGTDDGLEHKCNDCGGSGIQIKVMKRGNMVQQTQQMCTTCKGSGSDGKIKNCNKCAGKKLFKEKVDIKITIPKGAYEGTAVELQNMGNEIPHQDRHGEKTRSSIIIKIKEKKHDIYERGFTIPKFKEASHPKDLKTTINLTLAESLVGFSKTIKTLDGKQHPLYHEKIIKNGDVLVLPNFGMPILEKNGSNGNLYVIFDVEYPEEFSNNTKKILWQVLTNTPYKENNQLIKNKSSFETIEKYKYENTKDSFKNTHNFSGHPEFMRQQFEEDDMFNGGHPQGTECKVQ